MPTSSDSYRAQAISRAALKFKGAEAEADHELGWVLSGSDVVVEPALAATRFYRHGWQSWSIAGWERLDSPPASIAIPGLHRQADDPALGDRSDHVGSWVGVIEAEDGSAVLLGALGTDAWVSAGDGTLRGVAATEIDWFVAVGSGDEVLNNYGIALAGALGTRRSDPGAVWCTWYSQGRDVDSSSISGLISDVAKLPFDVFLIDDGWEKAIGNWTPNSGFPLGMGPVADEIASNDMRPGLWLAPLAVEVAEVESWRGCLVEDDSGQPVPAGRNWGTEYFAVDVSNKEALHRVIDTLESVVAWGFTYLKLDFLFAGAIPGRRASEEPREQIYRQAFAQIRESLGDDVHLNACGAPVIPSVGVFDSIRVGPDVAPYWESPLYEHVRDYSTPGTRRAIATSLARLWLGGAIQVDPDVVFFRTQQSLLDPAQRQTLQDLASITGFLATSDPPDWLDESQTGALRDFLSQTSEISRLDRYRFRIGEREVDFEPTVNGAFG
ncbi:MAG: glycoside hydrolase family 36 protein [Acidimicrobiia bacterium]